jgi:general secretion pathway protein M
MSLHPAIARTLQRQPALGALLYGAVLLACIATSWLTIAHLLDQRASLASATGFLVRLEQRWPAAKQSARAGGAPPGSPFIAGQTVTVAGSELLQRVSRAIASVGGRVLSSQVDVDTARRQPGFISVLVNCELDQSGLQKTLYDLEAGMPFLFVDRLEVQVPDSTGAAGLARMHVLLSVSGQWQAQP